MKRLTNPRFPTRHAVAISVAIGVVSGIGLPTARAVEMAELRGDFWYDTDGRPVAARHLNHLAGREDPGAYRRAPVDCPFQGQVHVSPVPRKPHCSDAGAERCPCVLRHPQRQLCFCLVGQCGAGGPWQYQAKVHVHVH